MDPLTWEQVDRADRAATAFSVAWMEHAARRFADPRRLTLTRFRGIVATAAVATPDLDFLNRVYGLRPGAAGLVQEIAEHYRRLGLRPWVELAPHPEFEGLADALTAAGWAQIGVYAGLVGRPARAASAGRFRIETVGTDEAPRFASLRVAGHQIPAEAAEAVVDWPSIPGVTVYMAYDGADPVGEAALLVHDGVGYLADASTVPPARGRGVQAALIARRLDDALTQGCDLVASLAAPYSASHRNLERGGLRLGYQLAVWRARR